MAAILERHAWLSTEMRPIKNVYKDFGVGILTDPCLSWNNVVKY